MPGRRLSITESQRMTDRGISLQILELDFVALVKANIWHILEHKISELQKKCAVQNQSKQNQSSYSDVVAMEINVLYST